MTRIKHTKPQVGLKSDHEPERSCIGCRSKHPKEKLLRLVRGPDLSLKVDFSQKLPGRGVYICGSCSCLDHAYRKHNFEKSLGVKLPKMEELAEQIEHYYRKEVLFHLGLSLKAHRLACGKEAVKAQITQDKVYLVLIAEDASERTQKEFEQLCLQNEISCVTFGNMGDLGDALGKRAPVGVVALTDSLLCRKITQAITLWKGFSGVSE